MASKMTKRQAETILALPEAYTYQDVQTAYRAKVKSTHPDVGGNPADMVEVNRAKSLIDKLFATDKTKIVTTSDPEPDPTPRTAPKRPDVDPDIAAKMQDEGFQEAMNAAANENSRRERGQRQRQAYKARYGSYDGDAMPRKHPRSQQDSTPEPNPSPANSTDDDLTLDIDAKLIRDILVNKVPWHVLFLIVSILVYAFSWTQGSFVNSVLAFALLGISVYDVTTGRVLDPLRQAIFNFFSRFV